MRFVSKGAATLFGGAVRARALAYELGLLPPREVDGVRIVSVGGLRAGGEGKTPMSLWLARRLHDSKRRVAVVCRGYRGRLEGPGGLLSDGLGTIMADARLGGDEATMIARRAPELVVVVGADRVEATLRARSLDAEAVVLDSGYQHLRLARHLDIALVGWPWDYRGEALLPAGPLREPPSALSRADLVGYRLEPGQAPADAPSEGFCFRTGPLEVVDEALAPAGGLEQLRGARVCLFSGIAKSDRFDQSCLELGARVVASLSFADHHWYRPRDRRKIVEAARRSGAELVLTTEKDIARLGGGLEGIALLGLRVEVTVERGLERIDEALGSAGLR